MSCDHLPRAIPLVSIAWAISMAATPAFIFQPVLSNALRALKLAVDFDLYNYGEEDAV
jgi:hypothetical protein